MEALCLAISMSFSKTSSMLLLENMKNDPNISSASSTTIDNDSISGKTVNLNDGENDDADAEAAEEVKSNVESFGVASSLRSTLYVNTKIQSQPPPPLSLLETSKKCLFAVDGILKLNLILPPRSEQVREQEECSSDKKSLKRRLDSSSHSFTTTTTTSPSFAMITSVSEDANVRFLFEGKLYNKKTPQTN